jgi:hypothetical protein
VDGTESTGENKSGQQTLSNDAVSSSDCVVSMSGCLVNSGVVGDSRSLVELLSRN